MVAFWNAYDAKGAEWKKLRPDDATVAAIMRGVAEWTESEGWRDGFAPGAHRFLKLRKWTGRPAPARSLRAAASGVVGRGDGQRQKEMIGR
jgi:hypothetical protein